MTHDPSQTFCEFCGELLGIPGREAGHLCHRPWAGEPGRVRRLQGQEGRITSSLPPDVEWDIQGRIELPPRLLVTMIEDPDERGFYMWDLEEEC